MSFATDFIYIEGPVLNDKAAAAAVIDNYSSIEHLPDKSSIFSAELHAIYLALNRVETADDDEFYHFLRLEVSSSGHFGPRLDTSSCPLHTGTPPLASTVPRERILFYWIPSHVGIRGKEKADAAAKAGLSRRVTNVPIPYGDFKKHINVLQMAVSVG